MKKKGFTLVELIVTIGIMALIGVVISTNMLGLFDKQADKDYEEFVNRMEEAACMYLETDSTKKNSCRNSSGCFITSAELIKKGYIDENQKDPNTQELIKNNSDYDVKVCFKNNVKKCEMKKNLNECR